MLDEYKFVVNTLDTFKVMMVKFVAVPPLVNTGDPLMYRIPFVYNRLGLFVIFFPDASTNVGMELGVLVSGPITAWDHAEVKANSKGSRVSNFFILDPDSRAGGINPWNGRSVIWYLAPGGSFNSLDHPVRIDRTRTRYHRPIHHSVSVNPVEEESTS